MAISNQLNRDVIIAVRLSYGWLREHSALVHSLSPHGLNAALEWVIAAWICEQSVSLGGDNPLSREGITEVARRVSGYGSSEPFSELLTCNVLSVVLAHNIAARHGVLSAPLTAFVGGLTCSLQQPAEAVADGEDLRETRLIVALAGLGQMPRLPSVDRLLDSSMLDLLQADESSVHRIADQIIVASAYGTREPIISTQLRLRLIDAMSVWLLDFARNYRLDKVALVMRSLTYLGELSALTGAIRFLVAQHHPSGHFGFFGPEAARARRLSPTWDEAASLHLPITFACLWALSECDDRRFRLLRSANG